MACTSCNATYTTSCLRQKCDCGGLLFARYHLDELRRTWSKTELGARSPSLWRYHELLPVADARFVVSLGESMTPVLPLPRLADEWDLPLLSVKDEGMLPSGTFKARGAAVGVSRAQELGAPALVMPSNGNAAAAWGLYAARAGLPLTVILPQAGPTTPRLECLVAGAKTYTVDGTIADASAIAQRLARDNGWYDVSTFHEPYRLEGKKTIGFEIVEQYGWTVPDVIVYPTGGGAGVVGIHKALAELREIGWIGDQLPRFALVQSEGCAPLFRAFASGADVSDPWPHPQTIAFGMRVPKPAADKLLLQIVRATRGIVATVSDEEIRVQREHLAAREGLHVCPEGAAAFAGARQLRALGWIRREDRVLVMNTGSGLKYMDQIANAAVPVPSSW